MLRTLLRKVFIGLLCLTLAWTSILIYPVQAGVSPTGVYLAAAKPVTSGEFPVQQAQYDDGNGEYTLMLLNTQPGQSPVFKSADLQMARVNPETDGKKETYLSFNAGQPVLHLTEDFRIEYFHAVTETQPNPQSGQPETVVIRRESNFWTPFAGAIAGQVVANMLFTPAYYLPPVYHPGGVMMGYGGYGSTYSSAVKSYEQKHNSPPAAVKNRQVLRTSGGLRNTAAGTTSRSGFGSKTQPTNAVNSANRTDRNNSLKSTGSGFGSSNLRSNGTVRPSRPSMQRRSSGFGSGGRSRARSFGGRRR